MNLTQRVVEWTGSIGADLVAAVPVEELEGVIQGYRPEELVPGARSVVVIALKMVDAVWDRLQGKKDFFSDVLRNYLASYNYPQLDYLAIRTARFLEDEGYSAFPVDGPSAGRVRHLGADSEDSGNPVAESVAESGQRHLGHPFCLQAHRSSGRHRRDRQEQPRHQSGIRTSGSVRMCGHRCRVGARPSRKFGETRRHLWQLPPLYRFLSRWGRLASMSKLAGPSSIGQRAIPIWTTASVLSARRSAPLERSTERGMAIPKSSLR